MIRFFAALLTVGWLFPARAQTPLDLSNAVVFAPATATMPEKKAAQLLVEEIQKRTRLRLKTSTVWPTGTEPVIAVGQGSTLAKTGKVPASANAPKPVAEGYQVRVEAGARPVVWVRGNDPRGTVFGAGYLLRNLRMERDKFSVPENLNATEAPKTALRGHQLGYRPKPNSYDGWDLRQWEQYIRELAMFGTNTIELVPPRTDDAADSPHFPAPQLETMIGMSQIAADYGLDVSVWYPALDADYGNPATVAASLREWGDVLGKLPKLDAVFVPSGDPGTTPPDELVALVGKQAEQLKKSHPTATWWLSIQGFSTQRLARFRELIEQNPPWLKGFAYAPWSRMPIAEFRKWVPERYPIRHYPDITHSHRCQYPVPEWDYPFAITQHREPINPRPNDFAQIFRLVRPYTIGSITYSEGCNDDVNKIVWSALTWNPDRPVRDILREYARTFIGPDVEESFADGLLALEQNWRGPMAQNVGIDSTLARFQRMEKAAPPPRLLNWRFQQALFRAYYDGYLRQRHRQEQDLERQALAALTDPRQSGSGQAVQRAKDLLAQVETAPVAMPLRVRLLELGEALFQSIRMQLYLGRHHKADRSDGAMLERLDTPLNNRPYLLTQFERIAALPGEPERQAELRKLAAGTSVGPGEFYDDLGNPAQQPHLLRAMAYADDPDFLRTPMVIHEQRAPNKERYPLAWHSNVMGLYDQVIRLRYEGLDPQAPYRVRVVYANGPVRLVANESTEIHPHLKKEMQLLEFDLPPETTRSGTLTLSWSGQSGGGDAGRGNQVSEVWVLKK